MTRERRGVLSYFIALGLFLAAAAAWIRFFGLAFTVGDAEFEPPEVCDATCREAFRRMGHQANIWLSASLILLGCSAALIVYGWRLRSTDSENRRSSV